MNLYVLVLWPEIQDLMEYEWFRKECVLYQTFDEDTDNPSSAYLVPRNRYEEHYKISIADIICEEE